ncbi:MAG TPA: hypothetical protein VK968_17365 [Roseimicrobium sp.]|nr:hypothetical protein [Roseimicrobium sp.]
MSSPSAPPTRKAAIGCALVNLLAWPGMGSLLVRRWVGIPQMLMSLGGFAAFTLFFFRIIKVALKATDTDRVLEAAKANAMLGLLGVAMVAIAWIWGGLTSISVWNASKKSPPPVSRK